MSGSPGTVPAPRLADDRLAELRRRHTLMSSVDGRDISFALEELERRRAADTDPLKLVWKEHVEGSWSGYSGKAIRASVYRIIGEDDWTWRVDGISTKYVVQGSGKRKYPAPARRAAEDAWTKWCRHSGIGAAFDTCRIEVKTE